MQTTDFIKIAFCKKTRTRVQANNANLSGNLGESVVEIKPHLYFSLYVCTTQFSFCAVCFANC